MMCFVLTPYFFKPGCVNTLDEFSWTGRREEVVGFSPSKK